MNKPWPWAWQWGELLLPVASRVTWEVRFSLVLLGAQATYIKLLGKRQNRHSVHGREPGPPIAKGR